MENNNFKSLDKLINNIKTQTPLIPIEEIENLSQGFFASSKAWFKTWVKPVGIAVAGLAILLITYFNVNTSSNNQNSKNEAQLITNPEASNKDSSEVIKSSIQPTMQPANEASTILTNLNPYRFSLFNEITEPTYNYTLTAQDSAVLNELNAETQTFQISALRDTMITGKYGTKLVFYKACFEDISGNVAKSTVNIQLKECYNYPDMVKENLNTHCDSGYLESKGMIWIEANSEGKNLSLREGFDLPIDFAGNIGSDYNLYYSNTNKYSNTNWQLDSLGKIPNPVIFPNSGRYWDITFNFFLDNYKFSKPTMLNLSNKSWGLHFTSVDTKMFGFTACTSADMYLNIACIKFRELCEDIYKEVPEIKHSSWETRFGFSAISRDSLNRWLANDTIQQKVNKALFGVNMRSPFFASQIGWINCDRNLNSPFAQRDNQVIRFTNHPKDGHTKTFLLLKSRRAIANPGELGSGPVFFNLPRNKEATLFSYKLVNGKISYFQTDINTSTDLITLGTYETLNNVDELVAKIEALTSPYLN
jgi:hypothetical protein